MGPWLASPGDALTHGVVKRFDPAFWTVNFPRPMMASAVTEGAHRLRVDCVFYRKDDLAGLIWEAEDRHDHPLLRYETSRDFRGCVLEFDWASQGLLALDAVHGPTLTIEGRDAAGSPRTWYVRLWNYAVGTSSAAHVRLDFAALAGGFSHPAETDPLWAGDIDRMFISSAWRRLDMIRSAAPSPPRPRAMRSFPTCVATGRARCWRSATAGCPRTGCAWRRGMTTSII